MSSQKKEHTQKKFEKRNQLDALADEVFMEKGLYEPPYGDVTELNSCRIIMDSVGKDTLREIAEDAVNLLDTSLAVYERNGDYAFGMFSSGWCRLMDGASRKLCRTDDNREALTCGKWLCHENCWNDSAKVAIETGASTDIQCVGGIHLYAEPIHANGQTVGAINIGYGTPPKEKNRLLELSELFGVELEKLLEKAQEYKPRPDFMINLAKKRLKTSAKLIGEIVEKTEAKNELQKNRAMFQAAMDNSQAGIAIARAPDGELLYVNDSAIRIRGKSKEEIVNGIGVNQYVSSWQILHFDGTPYSKAEVPLTRAIQSGEVCTEEFVVRRDDNTERIVLANAAPIKNDKGEIIYGIVVFLDITERKKAEQENVINRMRMDIIHKIATMPEASEKEISDYVLEKMLTLSDSQIGFIGYLSSDEEEMTIHSWSRKAMAECAIHKKPIKFPISQAGIWGEPVRTREPIILNNYHQFHPSKMGYPEGHVEVTRFLAVPVFYGERIVAVSAVGNKPTPYVETDSHQLILLMESWWDQIEKKHFYQEKQKLQAQINQAQKMESVGRLAGGVAHDFNNMLGIILGHTELALMQADENHDLYSDLKEIQTAANRSADITKQLLAFARKQTISPKQLDLNDTVESMLKMLQRLIGEDIDLFWQPATHLWPVKMDPAQIDQILANLCVNARDAISGVGKLTIETGRTTFDEEYCKEHAGFIPGDFVLLAVSDNGCGMDKHTLNNSFDPFFTTKEVDKGTGLGLSTIYGVVKQNNGFINVYSEPGQGSTFRIYFPRLVTDVDVDKDLPEKKAAAGGTETILLVEDEPTILRMTRLMLEKKGYTVLPAATPAEAVQEAKNHSGSIDLLMTDVVMPQMNGRDLARQIAELYPGIRFLFMSGYTANVIAHQGVLDDGVAFIQKPFSMADMTAKVREVLDKA